MELTNQSTSDKIRAVLKTQKITNRQVAIRTRSSQSVDVRVKDFSIDIEQLKQQVAEFESIRYCEYSQEILQGGNTFVFVEYDWKAVSALKASDEYKKLAAFVASKLSQIETGSSTGVEIVPGFVVFSSHNYNGSYQISAKYTDQSWIIVHGIDGVTFELFTATKQGKFDGIN